MNRESLKGLRVLIVGSWHPRLINGLRELGNLVFYAKNEKDAFFENDKKMPHIVVASAGFFSNGFALGLRKENPEVKIVSIGNGPEVFLGGGNGPDARTPNTTDSDDFNLFLARVYALRDRRRQ